MGIFAWFFEYGLDGVYDGFCVLVVEVLGVYLELVSGVFEEEAGP